jgi:drug/metabolite transporter (DMT)-like permease
MSKGMAEPHIATADWVRLCILSVLWGASFLFIGIAVKELDSLLIVFARVAIAALVLVPVHLVLKGGLPRDRSTWVKLGVMSILNNVIPFTAIVYGQHFITAGLASVINATTPLFGAVIMAVAAVEALTRRKITGLLLGLAGVVILKGVGFADLNQQTIGILAVMLASLSYALSGLWAKKNITGIPPVTSATCQLIVSSVVMAVLMLLFSDVTRLGNASSSAWFALIALAVVSTSIAYLIFFRIIASAGPSVVLLVTMMIPVSAIAMGAVFLDEALLMREIVGAVVIGLGLLVIDGRMVGKVGLK